MRYIIREPLAIVAGVLIILTVAVIIFSLASDLPERKPVVGVALFSLLPIFAIAGAVTFYLAIRSEGFRGEEDEQEASPDH